MTDEPEKKRNNAVTIEEAETKTSTRGAYWRIKAGGIWYSCFETLVPIPAQGQAWACNVTQKTSKGKTYNNLVDMVHIPQENSPVSTESVIPPPAQQPTGQAPQQQRVPQQSPVLDETTLRITRLACIKAAGYSCHIDMSSEVSVKEGALRVLQVAEIYFKKVVG